MYNAPDSKVFVTDLGNTYRFTLFKGVFSSMKII